MESYYLLAVLVILRCEYETVNAKDISYMIKEEQPLNTLVGNVGEDLQTVDILTSENTNSLSYSILTSGNQHAKLFNISSSEGQLRIARRIDRETLCPFRLVCGLHLQVAVHSDASVYSFTIKLTIQDTNDNEPTFGNKTISLQIPESSPIGASFPFTGAVDRDIEENSLHSYEIIPNNAPFRVNFTKNLDGTSTVILYVKEELDRETQEGYYLTLLAKDNGVPQKSGTTVLKVTVLDANDNAPQFTYSVYNVTIKENTPLNTTFIRVSAQDVDKGINRELFYRLSNHQAREIMEYFAIDKTVGDISLKKSLPSGFRRIIVEASDKGTPSKSSQTFVDITILDTNNQHPSITVNLFNGIEVAHISEAKNVGYPFAHVKVLDSDTGSNGDVQCYCPNINFDLKQLGIKEYKVIIAKKLDREIATHYTVVIFCEDLGKPKLTATASIEVEIDDENDSVPYFVQKSYFLNILENEDIGGIGIQVSAKDKDTGTNAQITYKLSDDAWPYFRLEPGSSIIKPIRPFDREEKSEYKFQVYAIDGGESPNTASALVTVIIKDVNDEHPTFNSSSYTFYIRENVPSKTVIGTISVTDQDTGFGGVISLQLVTSNTQTVFPFFIRQNGTLLAMSDIDAERQSRYNFKVVATDQGEKPLSSSVDVTVIILDVNDNKPIFDFPRSSNNSVTVYTPQTAGFSISRVIAHDPDISDGSNLLYSLFDKNRSSVFEINKTSGHVYLLKNIDISHVGYYELLITVMDKHRNPYYEMEILQVFIKYKIMDPLDYRHEEYVLIVASLVCVTLVVAAVVLGVLCFLWKRDQDNDSDQVLSQSSGSLGIHNLGMDADTSKSEVNMEDSLDQLHDKSFCNESLEEKVMFRVAMSDVLEGTATADRAHQKLNQLASFRLHQALREMNSDPAELQVSTPRGAALPNRKHGNFHEVSRWMRGFHSNSLENIRTHIHDDDNNDNDDDIIRHNNVTTYPHRIKLGVRDIRRKPLDPARSDQFFTQTLPFDRQSRGRQQMSHITKSKSNDLVSSKCVPFSIENGPQPQQRPVSEESDSETREDFLDSLAAASASAVGAGQTESVASHMTFFSKPIVPRLPLEKLDISMMTESEAPPSYRSTVPSSILSSTTTSGSYSISLEDIKPNISDIVFARVTDVYV
ncbi:protocadherin-9-like [Gigantopelta aegis]|uniref:protocadherin-9-like n=1 Tax=Gigantopelta aegis TaxID=1735272 RepID=UPI001B88D44F|nr:protocadherin-9-like [Gigantopelta aegis]